MIKKMSTNYILLNEDSNEYIEATIYEHEITIIPRKSGEKFTFIKSNPERVKRIANLILEASEIKF